MVSREFRMGNARRAVCEITILLGIGIGLVLGAANHADADEAELPGTIEFVGRNTFATADGVFHTWRLVSHTVDPLDLESAQATVEVDLASVDTGVNRRDDHLRNPDFFEVETYPTALIRVHSPEPNGTTDSGASRFSARFEIDLHGVKKTVPGEVVMESASPPVFSGSLVIDRTDFGVGAPPSRWNPMSVKADIPIRFRVELTKRVLPE